MREEIENSGQIIWDYVGNWNLGLHRKIIPGGHFITLSFAAQELASPLSGMMFWDDISPKFYVMFILPWLGPQFIVCWNRLQHREGRLRTWIGEAAETLLMSCNLILMSTNIHAVQKYKHGQVEKILLCNSVWSKYVEEGRNYYVWAWWRQSALAHKMCSNTTTTCVRN